MSEILDPLAYTISAIKSCRHRFFPFLYQDLSSQDLMADARSLAWLILTEENPSSKKDIYNAVQRCLYREAKNDGWRRSRGHGMRYIRDAESGLDIELFS